MGVTQRRKVFIGAAHPVIPLRMNLRSLHLIAKMKKTVYKFTEEGDTRIVSIELLFIIVQPSIKLGKSRSDQIKQLTGYQSYHTKKQMCFKPSVSIHSLREREEHMRNIQVCSAAMRYHSNKM